MINVIAKYDRTKYPSRTYIGRGSPLGNPFPMANESERDDVIAKYSDWLQAAIARREPKVVNELNAIWREAKAGKPVHLECFCAPRKCHGDVIKAVIENVI